MPSYAKNKKAFHDYEILEQYEAGIVLHGDEVKSIKNSQANLTGAFIDVTKQEAYVRDMQISRYKQSSNPDLELNRRRKLILHKKEILKIEALIQQKGVTAIPLELYSAKGLVKIKIGICRGKKLYDKRETIKKRDQDIEIRRDVKNYR
ncbi:MAG: SsrA-binding protein SmpB [Patescibacteria group bacterium]